MLHNIPSYLLNPTFIFLCLMSLYSVMIMVDQAMFLLSNREDVENLLKFMDDDRKTATDLETFATARKTLHRRLILHGLRHIEKPSDIFMILVGEEAMSLRWEAERRLAALGTIANIAPFVGLFGTVVGVINAFHAISLKAGAGPAVVSAGISEALVSTAAGLFVAIPAVVAYNFFLKRARKLSLEFERVSSLLVYRVKK